MKTKQEVENISTVQSEIKEVFDKKRILKAAMMCLAAAAVAFCGLSFFADDSMPQGVIFAIVALVVIFAGYYALNSRVRVWTVTGSKIIENSVFLDQNDAERLKKILDSEKAVVETNIHPKDSGKYRLDYLRSDDGQLCTVRMMEFVPYYYQEYTPIYHLHPENREWIERLTKKQ